MTLNVMFLTYTIYTAYKIYTRITSDKLKPNSLLITHKRSLNNAILKASTNVSFNGYRLYNKI